MLPQPVAEARAHSQQRRLHVSSQPQRQRQGEAVLASLQLGPPAA
jgi:hypothetical protein